MLLLVAKRETCSISLSYCNICNKHVVCVTYICLSLLIVTTNVVLQQVVISDACNHLVHKNERVLSVVRHPKNERVLSVVRHQDNVKQLCVVVILSHTNEAVVIVLVQLIASIS